MHLYWLTALVLIERAPLSAATRKSRFYSIPSDTETGTPALRAAGTGVKQELSSLAETMDCDKDGTNDDLGCTDRADVESLTPSIAPITLPTLGAVRDSSTATTGGTIPSFPMIPRCDLSRKVGYKCGEDTIVCNSGVLAPANIVCDLQPVMPGGRLVSWGDSIPFTSGGCDSGGDDCWCKSMANGVSKPGPQNQALFPHDVLCPNGEYVESYVCYFPFDDESEMFLVDRFDYDNDGSWTTPCSGYQPLDELPSVLDYTGGAAMPTTTSPIMDSSIGPISNPPSASPSADPTGEPTGSPSDILQVDKSQTAFPMIPRCDLTRKVGYKCGDDTIVCNSGASAPANAVCDIQPVMSGGSLVSWIDAIPITSGGCDTGGDDCWCKSMANGVSKPGPQSQALFPHDVLCPNGEYVESYVCYFPYDDDSEMFRVDRFDYDNDGSWITPCSGYQPLDELPSVLDYTAGEAKPTITSPTMDSSTGPTYSPSNSPSASPSADPTGEPTGSPSSLPTTESSNQPTGSPSSLPTTESSNQPTGSPSSFPTTESSNQPTASLTVVPTGSQSDILQVDKSRPAFPMIPRCDLTKKVGYKCGDDTIVCNAGASAPANAVCDLQPVMSGGKLYSWSDSIPITIGGCDIGEDDCWCKSMANGVSKPGPQNQALFPHDVLCPNGEFVESYVCYFPFDDDSEMFRVDRFDYDNDGSWITPCSGYQPLDELPPALEYTTGEAEPTSSPSSSPTEGPSVSVHPSSSPSSSPTATSDYPSSDPTSSPTKSAHPSKLPTERPTASAHPSSGPTSSPSASVYPSSRPTTSPTASAYPSSGPTSRPSKSAHPSSPPTGGPTASAYPSFDPTSSPSASAYPSSRPSSSPTKSAYPSSPPSIGPSESVYPSSSPTSSPTTSTSPIGAPSSSPTMKISAPGCQFEEKVGYQCGDDTIVCNSPIYSPPDEVCAEQPVRDGNLISWTDTVLLAKNETCDEGNCWCQHMAAGVSSGSANFDEMFPSDVSCPNGQTVSSYVCYLPSLGGSSFKVNQVEVVNDDGDLTFVEPCTGYQPRSELPPVISFPPLN